MKKILGFVILLILLSIIPVFSAKKLNINSLDNNKIINVEDIYEDLDNTIKVRDLRIVKNEYASNSYLITGYLYNNSENDIDYTYNIILLNTYSLYGLKDKRTYTSSIKSYETKYINLVISTNFDVNYFSFNAVVNSSKSVNSFEYKKVTADYVINSYNIEINVLEDNTFEITEKISAYFNKYKHGIFRKIPLRNVVTRLDGTTSRNRANIYDISVNEQYTLSNDNGYRVIKIGSPNYTIIGSKDYIIKYKYNIGKDPLKDMDELYYNLIGSEWDTAINNVTFKITMPKEFDASKLGFSNGASGKTTNNVTYTVKGNVISGKLNGYLSSYEALTVRLELPEGYFKKPKLHFSTSDFIVIIISVVCVSIALIMWTIYGNDKPIVETVEFNPINNLNPLEISLIYKGKCTREDVTSLLLHLANKGYLVINQTSKHFNNYSIDKIKNYDGNNKEEEIFMEGLFGSKTHVTSSDLKYKFYKTVDKIIKSINSKERKEKYFQNNGFATVIAFIALVVNILSMIFIPTILNGGNIGNAISLIFILAFYTPFYLVGFKSDMPFIVRIIWLGFTILHSCAFLSAMVFSNLVIYDVTQLIPYIVGIISVVIICICIKYMPNRTEEGLELYGRIKGFKKYLKTAEKSRIERMVFQNPSYFYDILPYAFVLSVSKVWMDKFNDILLTPPDWYGGSDNFTVKSFNSFISDTMSSATTTMNSTYSSSSSGGGGFSGGGSSGGGSGGGGGGSW